MSAGQNKYLILIKLLLPAGTWIAVFTVELTLFPVNVIYWDAFSGSERLLFLCFSSKLLGIYIYLFFYYVFQHQLHVWSVSRLRNVERMLKKPFHMWAGCQFYGRDLFISYRLKLNPTCDGVQFLVRTSVYH